ncbi:hypothetical protein GGP54_002781 [Salinibacter ruber]|uniref:Uncharacterized protein n=1 Tax=Salinibacter ruber TaxID=146919 RepID=A0A9X2ZZL0_9BACT|nr:hypothetical protein [Salinibacter ruber]MCS4037243.1 hypothetical protein [Salinibacter ruber]
MVRDSEESLPCEFSRRWPPSGIGTEGFGTEGLFLQFVAVSDAQNQMHETAL